MSDSSLDPLDDASMPLLVRLVEPEPIPRVLLVRPPHPGFWWAVLWCVGYLTVTQLPGSLIALTILFLRVPVDDLRNPEEIFRSAEFSLAIGVALFLAQVLGVVAGVVVVRLMLGRQWPRILGLRLPSATHLLLALLGLPAMLVLAAGVDLLGQEFLPSFQLDEMMNVFGEWPMWFSILTIGLGPGLAEELWCRGFLGRGLVGRHGVVGGVLLTSLLFGLMHMEPRQVVYTFLMGILLHLAYLATRSLWVPILLHVLNNSLAVLILQLPPPWPQLDHTPELIPWHIFPAAVLLLSAVGWALYQSRARLVDAAPQALYSRRSPYPGVEHPSPLHDTVLVRPSLSLMSWSAVIVGVVVFALALWGLIQGVRAV
jgi:membrane protease YdiL (CAAX protease family)